MAFFLMVYPNIHCFLGQKELKEWKHTFGHGLHAQPTVTDEIMASKLTNHQKGMIRLHQQLLTALETIQNLPIVGQRTQNNSGRGIVADADYTPSELKIGLSVTWIL